MLLSAGLACSIPSPPEQEEVKADLPASPLAEALYAGEVGTQARAMGDRIRMLTWLRGLSLSPEELLELHTTSRRIQALSEDLQVALHNLGEAELKRLEQPYTELATALARNETTATDLEDWSKRITESRAQGQDPRALRANFVDGVLQEATAFLDGLDPEKQRGMADGLFLLRTHLGDGAAPASFEDLLGTPWRAEEYSTLRKSASPTDVDHLDIGGLWTLEAGALDRSDRILGDKLLVITTLALSHPELPASCEVLLGKREPLSFGEPPG
ncbi:MAG: hypothetical protein VX519_06475 [Myxococcota bacterium]|nr:hypothetical protein [Myxococcota bacterium]